MRYTANKDPFGNSDSYFAALPRHAKVLIPALNSRLDEEDGAYLALGEVRRFFFDPARSSTEQVQVLAFVNHALKTGGDDTETAIVLELFTQAYYCNEPFTSLFQHQLSPTAWALFLNHREIECQRGIYIVTDEGQSRPFVD
jgi:hypothetical protein